MNRLGLINQAISSPPPLTFDNLQLLQLTKTDKIATIWFNNPDLLNAISPKMAEEMKFLLINLDRDDSIKIIVLRSKHATVFCVGADIKECLLTNGDRYHSVFFLDLVKAIRNTRKPLISVVNGDALGGGFELVLLSDIALASDRAKFGIPQINLGIMPTMGATQLLGKLVGTKVASRLILTGESIGVEQAYRLNLVHWIQGQKFQQKVQQFLNKLTEKAMDSLEYGKQAVKLSQDTTLEQGLEHETTLFQALFNKKGAKEGLAAFLEKRKPNFKNI